MANNDAAERAVALKAEGNAFFRTGVFDKAGDCYAEAERLAPGDPVYPSNLSAALFEQGAYTACVEAAARSWRILQGDPATAIGSSATGTSVNSDANARAADATGTTSSDALTNTPLALRLAARTAKALGHAVRGGADAEGANGVCAAHGDVLAEMARMAVAERGAGGAEQAECAACWAHWFGVRDENNNDDENDGADGAARAAARVRAREDARSRFRGMPMLKCAPSPALEFYTLGHDDVIPLRASAGEANEQAISLAMLTDAQLSDMSFLFGGVGDARHVFGTVVDMYHNAQTLRASQGAALRLHVTMMDIQPAALARDLVIIQLLEDLARAPAADATARLEIHAAVFYAYCAYLMPDYCHDRIMRAAQTMEARLAPGGQMPLPAWLHVSAGSTPALRRALRHWSAPLPKSAQYVLDHHTFPPLEHAENNERYALANLLGEGAWYSTAAPVLLPPKELCGRHPGFEWPYADAADQDGPAVKRKMAAAKKHVAETWKVNPTIFDPDEVPTMFRDGYPPLQYDPLETPGQLFDFNDRFEEDPNFKAPNESPSFIHVTKFFDAFVDALRALAGRVTLEVVCAELTQDLVKMTTGEFPDRPEAFPRKFTRMWLSNVPDYTHGPLNAIVYTMPSLQDMPHATVAFDCLYNTSAFATEEHYCHTYTLLRIKDVPRYLGVRFVRSDVPLLFETVMAPLPLPRPLSLLASREELTLWLHRILLCTLVNGNPLPMPQRVDLPNNTAAFVALLVHLHKVGFPAHWLAHILQCVLADDVTTTAAPYLGRLPVPPTDVFNQKPARKVHLWPWRADFEAVIARALEALPFALRLPRDFPARADIRTYSAWGLQPTDLRMHRLYPAWHRLASPHVRVVGLIFYRPAECDAEDIAHQLAYVLEGDDDVPEGDMQVILSLVKADISNGLVSWQMSAHWYARMCAEGWMFAAYRTDIVVAITTPARVNVAVEARR